MYRKEVNAQSPLRILEQSIHGGLGTGNLGIVAARAGVGKTACLVQIGLDDLLRERTVLHVALEQTVEHVQSWYDTLFDDLVMQTDLQNRDEVHAGITRRRMITSFGDHDIWPARLEKMVETFRTHLDFKPTAILIDGYPWSSHSVAENAAMIGALKAHAKMSGAEVWMTAQTHRDPAGDRPTRVPPPCDDYLALLDVVLFLEPHGDDVAIRLLKDHDQEKIADTHLHLHPDTMRLVVDRTGRKVPVMPHSTFTLLSGGAEGAEAEFGRCAEAWGMMELNFTFEGRNPVRKRGIVRLTEEELAEGAVSAVYIEAHMHRTYPNTPLFRKTLQSIWHQVNTSAEVFAVGLVLPDGTVKGGTGWAAELARVWHKPVYVFDQERKAWLTWSGDAWVDAGEPKITSRRFTGTGTRFLSDDGRAAIVALFERSFGPAPA